MYFIICDIYLQYLAFVPSVVAVDNACDDAEEY